VIRELSQESSQGRLRGDWSKRLAETGRVWSERLVSSTVIALAEMVSGDEQLSRGLSADTSGTTGDTRRTGNSERRKH
jgi:hypothetical protein